MTPSRRRTALTAVIAVTALTLLTGCSQKAQERYKDGPRSGVSNDGPADLIRMPDGFSNVATKCDHGNRVYSLFHGDSKYGGIAVVAGDPTC